MVALIDTHPERLNTNLHFLTEHRYYCAGFASLESMIRTLKNYRPKVVLVDSVPPKNIADLLEYFGVPIVISDASGYLQSLRALGVWPTIPFKVVSCG